MTAVEHCPGCGLEHEPHSGPSHPYIGASSACWELFGEVLAREYGPLGMPDGHRLTVDAYAVQHPGRPERRAIQSVGLHLIALHLLLERGETPATVRARMNELAARSPALAWLDPPQPNGTLTIEHVLAAGLEQHTDCVREWAEDVWRAWGPYHQVVRGWAQRA